MFRFTIRDVLWLTVVMALAVGWYCQISSEREWARQALRTHVIMDLKLGELGFFVDHTNGEIIPK
jgi:hypothetical protein